MQAQRSGELMDEVRIAVHAVGPGTLPECPTGRIRACLGSTRGSPFAPRNGAVKRHPGVPDDPGSPPYSGTTAGPVVSDVM